MAPYPQGSHIQIPCIAPQKRNQADGAARKLISLENDHSSFTSAIKERRRTKRWASFRITERDKASNDLFLWTLNFNATQVRYVL
jgi:hypothetical protein